MQTFAISTELTVTPQAFWQRMSMATVNAELMPLVRMTAPPAWRHRPLAQWTAGHVLFRSVILLFGFIPVDVHALRFEHLFPEGGFLERSQSWANRLWQHERTTIPTASGCIVTDRLTVQGRVPFAAVMLMPVYRLVFRHRHRRMRALYGAARHVKLAK